MFFSNFNLFYFFGNWDIATLMGFSKPVNDIIYGITLLLTEMTIFLSYILFAVLLCLAYIVDIFSAEVNPFARHFEKSVEATLDVIFVVFPTFIILYFLIPSLGFILNTEIDPNVAFSLDVIGHQWYWSYEYNLNLSSILYGLINNENSLINKLEYDSLIEQEARINRLLQVDKRVLLPVNTVINVRVTSQDVIHSWAIPQLGVKTDAIPGRIININLFSNTTGIFYGQCSELCGVNHAFMPIVVQFVEPSMFIDWLLCSIKNNISRELLSIFYKRI